MWRIFPQQPTMHLKNGKMQWIQPAEGSVLVDDRGCLHNVQVAPLTIADGKAQVSN